MNYQQVTFIKSAAKISQLPKDEGIEVAFVGRSNAGKSSLLNFLTNTKNLAFTSKTPGRTQLINLFNVDAENSKRLVDLPGYGYAKVSEKIKQNWQKTLSLYLQNRASLKGVILLTDCRHPLKESDLNIVEWANHTNLNLHIVLTKSDKLSKLQQQKCLAQVKKKLSGKFRYSCQMISTTKRVGLEELQYKLNKFFC